MCQFTALANLKRMSAHHDMTQQSRGIERQRGRDSDKSNEERSRFDLSL